MILDWKTECKNDVYYTQVGTQVYHNSYLNSTKLFVDMCRINLKFIRKRKGASRKQTTGYQRREKKEGVIKLGVWE